MLSLVATRTPPQAAQTPEQHPIIISVGEHFEITLPKRAKMAVGNRDIIAHKLLKQRSVLLIKGKKIGHTSIMVWPEGQNTTSQASQHQVFVISKREQLKAGQLNQMLQSLGLSASMHGPPFVVSGEIAQLQHYQLFIGLHQRFGSDMQVQMTLAPQLERQVLAHVYDSLLGEYHELADCHFRQGLLHCQVASDNGQLPERALQLAKEYGVVFSPSPQLLQQNFLARLKIIQIEAQDLEDIDWGMSEIKSTWRQWFGAGPKNYAAEQTFYLSKKNVQFRVLAEPEIVIRPGKKANLQVGQEFSYQIPDTGNQRGGVDWKFSGLDIALLAERRGPHLEIFFETRLSRPSDDTSVNQMSSSKQQSSALIALDTPLSIFDITLETQGEAQQALPWVARLPLMGKLFQSNATSKGHKKITGVMVFSREVTHER